MKTQGRKAIGRDFIYVYEMYTFRYLYLKSIRYKDMRAWTGTYPTDKERIEI
jgi:hypothetical protein